MNPQVFEASLEQIATHLGDPAAPVYDALFERAPELEALFILDTDGTVRGEMLSRVFDSLGDIVNEAGYAPEMVGAEYINHRGMGVPAGGFELLLDVMIETFRTHLGEHWTAEFEETWQALKAAMHAIETEADS